VSAALPTMGGAALIRLATGDSYIAQRCELRDGWLVALARPKTQPGRDLWWYWWPQHVVVAVRSAR